MGTDDRLTKLLEGVEVWNAWRRSEGCVAVELQGAKLRKAKLSRADLSRADLTDADLDGALLFGANLYAACLQGARFYVSNLSGADLRGANLSKAYLRGADLRQADLRDADLRDADFRGANLRYADLRNANLRGADLRDADLRDSDLRGVNLNFVLKAGASLEGANLAEAPHPEILGESVMQRLRHALVDPGHMTEEELEEAKRTCTAYTKFREEHPDRHWPLLTMVAFVEATKPHLMFRAWAAVHDKPFSGITALCESLYELFGKDFFEGRTLTRPIASGQSFGEILHAMGAISAKQLEDARSLRLEIEMGVGIRLFLGTLLVRSSLITLGEYYQALAIHYGVEFTGLNDETVARIAAEWAEFSDLQTRSVHGH